VFVPSYNHAQFVERCLRSVFAQTHPPSFLLVIDDGSSDNSASVIDHVLEDCPFPTEFIVRPNRGLGATLNQALEHGSEPLFAYLGSDDEWHPNRLKEAVRAFEGAVRAVASFGDCLLIDERDRIMNVAVFASLEGRRRLPWSHSAQVPMVNLESLLRFRTIPLSPTVTYRRQAVEQFGWNETSRTEDYEMYMLLAAVGDFVYIDQPLGSWRLHAGNTSKDLEVMLEAALTAQVRVARRLGVSPTALRHYQRCVRYSYGEYFLRAGRWRRGVSLTIGNLSGAPSSASAIVERGARLALPSVLVQRVASARRRA
jgi:alpha-1,3-rhamnosyltransferase